MEDVSQTSTNVDRNDVITGPTAEAVDIQPSDKDPLPLEPTNPYQGVGKVPEVQVSPAGKGSVESVSLFDELPKEESAVDDSDFIVQPGERKKLKTL